MHHSRVDAMCLWVTCVSSSTAPFLLHETPSPTPNSSPPEKHEKFPENAEGGMNHWRLSVLCVLISFFFVFVIIVLLGITDTNIIVVTVIYYKGFVCAALSISLITVIIIWIISIIIIIIEAVIPFFLQGREKIAKK